MKSDNMTDNQFVDSVLSKCRAYVAAFIRTREGRVLIDEIKEAQQKLKGLKRPLEI